LAKSKPDVASFLEKQHKDLEWMANLLETKLNRELILDDPSIPQELYKRKEQKREARAVALQYLKKLLEECQSQIPKTPLEKELSDVRRNFFLFFFFQFG
jgi:hypothetical protein